MKSGILPHKFILKKKFGEDQITSDGSALQSGAHAPSQLEAAESARFPFSNCTIYCISCFAKRIKLTSIFLGCGVALTDLTRTAFSELKCYDEYLNWN